MPFIAAGSCEPLRVWNRLEPRPRQVDFADALSARIHDPMFLLARQWQFGEFAGEDGGSAVAATIARRVTPVELAVAPSPGPAPRGWEPAVERLPIQFPPLVRARLGRTAMAHLDGAFAAAGTLATSYDPEHYRTLFREQFGLVDAVPADPVGQARDLAAPRARRARQALAGRAVDGIALLATATSGTLPGGLLAGIVPGHLSIVKAGLTAYREWFELTYGPLDEGDGSWRPAQLEYGGEARAGDGDLLTLDEHVGGRLDWYSFDEAQRDTPGGPTVSDIRTVIPSPATFPGMPKPRWWQLEDADVDLGRLRADTTDTARIVVTEFALLFGNNWFVVPCTQPVGTIAQVAGVIVTDVFGWRTLVEPPRTADSWAGWELFSLSARGSAAPVISRPQHLFLPATLVHHDQAPAHEDVVLVRDETADMVWAVERRIPDGMGGSRDGAEAARRLREQLGRDGGQPPREGPPQLRYVAMNEVAENWIPFLPVHLPAGTRAIRLQRGAMTRPGSSAGDRVRPVTSILREGIPADDSRATAYFINEEEVPRAGVVVRGVMRRARDFDGAPTVWHARTVSTGRGGGHSGLQFDRVES